MKCSYRKYINPHMYYNIETKERNIHLNRLSNPLYKKYNKSRGYKGYSKKCKEP